MFAVVFIFNILNMILTPYMAVSSIEFGFELGRLVLNFAGQISMLKMILSLVVEKKMNNRPIHFELQADDLERAMKFYGDVFGWKFENYSQLVDSPYFGIITGEEGTPGINGGIQGRTANRPGLGMGTNAATISMDVEDYELYELKILKSGGQVALPKIALIVSAWQGYYLDNEGNVFGIHQLDESAGL